MFSAPYSLVSSDDFNGALIRALNAAHALLETGDKDEFFPIFTTYEQDGAQILESLHVLQNFVPQFGGPIMATIGYKMGLAQQAVQMAFMSIGTRIVAPEEESEPGEERPDGWQPFHDLTEVILVSGMTIDGRRSVGYVPVTRTDKEMMLPGEPWFEAYVEGKESSVKSLDDFLAAWKQGWHKGFGEAVSRLN